METPINPKKPSSKSYWTKFQFLSKFLFRTKRPFRLTRGGWIFILYTIGVGAGAINTGNNLLYLVFGLFLGLILASGVLSDLVLWGVTVDPALPLSGRAGEPLYFPIKLANTKQWFPSLSVRIEMETATGEDAANGQAYCPSIERHSSASALLVIHPRRRGLLKITKLTLLTRFPFGLLTKSWSVTNQGETMLIYPSLIPVQKELLQFSLERPDARLDSPHRGDGVNPYGIREYQSSDSPKRIHWRASAKRSEGWLVKEMEREKEEDVRLSWPESSFFSGMPVDERETFVSFAASLADSLERRGKKTSLLMANGKEAASIEGDELWKFLSLVDLSQDRAGFPAPSDALSLGSLFEEWRKKNAA